MTHFEDYRTGRVELAVGNPRIGNRITLSWPIMRVVSLARAFDPRDCAEVFVRVVERFVVPLLGTLGVGPETPAAAVLSGGEVY
ncbi:MAG: hypothetical protein ABR585_03580 [Gemmatimonadaceae bacterium]